MAKKPTVRKIVDYKIVEGKDNSWVCKEVVKLIKDGYELYGELHYCYSNIYTSKYQVVVKYSE